MKSCILVINPGSTSTKVAIFDGEALQFEENIEHSAADLSQFVTMDDQFMFRKDAIIDYLARINIALSELTAIASRGGTLGQLEPGAYLITEPFLAALKRANVHHPANLCPSIAYELGREAGVNAYCYDVVCGAGKPQELYTISGIPEISRRFETHVLNSRAVCFEQAKRDGVAITEATYIVAHMGGGITTNLIEKGIIRDLVSDDEGTFSPERAGRVPCNSLIKLCYSGKYTEDEMRKLSKGKGGFTAYLGTNDLREIESRIDNGDAKAELIFNAMALQIAKDIASLSVTVFGKVDKIILTGGMAHSERLTDIICKRIAHIAEISLIPGAFEMEALGKGVYRVTQGIEQPNEYID